MNSHIRLSKIYNKLKKEINYLDSLISENYIDCMNEEKEEKRKLEYKLSRVENMIFRLWGL